jgi:hypothetical protein
MITKLVFLSLSLIYYDVPAQMTTHTVSIMQRRGTRFEPDALSYEFRVINSTLTKRVLDPKTVSKT